MDALIDQLFSKEQSEAIKKLWEDRNSRLLLHREIGKQLINYDSIVNGISFSQLMFITSLSPFADSIDECRDVASIIFWGIKETNILPFITEHSGKEFAYRCLISLGFFKKALIKRWERHAAPSPDFYRNAGIKSFKEIGLIDVGSHFHQWEGFMGEMFV